MKILRASNDEDIAQMHQTELQGRGHTIMLCKTGEECFYTYSRRMRYSRRTGPLITPEESDFDVVLLDCEIEDMDALELGKRILSLNPDQRIILASANIQETITRVMKEFDIPAQIIQKPITSEILISSLEDEGVYLELRKFRTESDIIKKRIEFNDV
jgi:CheY-like chemotaxis protein